MLITDDIFYAFLQCETKAHLKLTGAVGDQRAFSEWERPLVEDYKQQCYRQWRADYGEAACLVGGAFPHDLDHSQCRFVMDCTVRTQEMQAHLHAVEWVATPDKPHDSPYMPIRCVPREKITTQDKLLLAFDALVLWTISDEAPRFGKIIHGRKQATAKVELAGWTWPRRSSARLLPSKPIQHHRRLFSTHIVPRVNSKRAVARSLSRRTS